MNSHKLAALITRCKAEMGFNPLTIYCQVTGKPIGQLAETELAIMIQQAGHCDPEDLVSELWTRTIASMRPGPAWNYIRRDSMEKMLNQQPKDLLAYLLNRLYDPTNHNMSIDQRFQVLSTRISVYERIQTLDLETESFNQLLLVLLDLDTKFGIKGRFMQHELLQLDWFLSHENSIVGLIRQLNEWLESQTAAVALAEKKALNTQRFYAKGNSLTRQAFVTQFTRVMPPSKAGAERKAKEAEKDFFAMILDSIMVGEHETTSEAKLEEIRVQAASGVFVPGKRPMRFGKKEA